MAEDSIVDTQQTQTQKSQIEWSQNTSSIPTIWGRLYSKKVSLGGKHCWKNSNKGNTEYFDLINQEFTLGRALTCTFVMKKNIVREDIIINISKQHFIITRDISEHLSPAIITDLSYNGTFVNEKKIGKGNSRVLDDNDEISVTHPLVKIFTFKDLLKNDQDSMPKLISEKYYISRTLGQGACGVVKLVYDKVKCTKHAMKIVKKVKFTDGTVNSLCDPVKIKNEIDIMKSLKHPLIVSTEEVFESYSAMYIVLELMEGGELFDRISKQGRLSETQTKFFFRQMVIALMYLHSQGITHRDLKPENVLLESNEDETRVKISDFGLSKFVGAASMKTMCGTLLYVAPEVLLARGRKRYGPQVDVWSLGVILFICLSGYLPFSQEYSKAPLEQQIISGRWRQSAPHWAGVGARARDLVRRMLTVKPNLRITPLEILRHPWLQDTDVAIRVERLLNSDLIISSTSNSPRDDIENRPVLTVRAKRALSEDAACDHQHVNKKIKTVFANDMSDDTTSINSVDYQ